MKKTILFLISIVCLIGFSSNPIFAEPTGVTLLGGTDFENHTLGSWSCSNGDWILSYTDTDLDDIPFVINYWETLLQCSGDPSYSPISSYHDISIETINDNKWLKSTNVNVIYDPNQNRNVLRALNVTDDTYDEVFLEWKMRVPSTFLNGIETQSGGAWISLNTFFVSGQSSCMVRLFSGSASDDGVQFALALDDDLTERASSTMVVGSNVGAPTPPQNQYYIFTDTEVEADTTYHVKLYYKGDTTNGEIKLWVDDVLIVHVTGNIDDGASPTAMHYCKIYGSENGTIDQIIYWDDFYVWDTYTEGVVPTVIITTPDPSNTSTGNLSIAGTATGGTISQCKYRIGSAPDGSNGTALTGTSNWSGTATGFSGGSNELYVGCYNGSNWGSDSITVNYNTGADLLFQNGFESPVVVNDGVNGRSGYDGNYWDWSMDGADPDDLCSDMPGAQTGLYSNCWMRTLLPTAYTFSDYFNIAIETDATSPGEDDKVLKINQKDYKWYMGDCTGPGTPYSCCTGVDTGSCSGSRFQWNVAPSGSTPPNDLEEFYFQYYIRIKDIDNLPNDSTYMLTEHLVGSSNQRNHVYIVRQSPTNSGNLFWRCELEAAGYNQINTGTEVPINTWFKFGIYFKSSMGTDGRYVVFINDVPLFNYTGVTNDLSYVGTVNPLKIYSYTHVSYTAYIDDFLWFDGLPALPYGGTPPDPEAAPLFVGAEIKTDDTIDIAFNKIVEVNNSSGFVLSNVDSGASIDSYVSGSGTTILTYSLTDSVSPSDSDIELAYTGPAANAIEEAITSGDGTDLEDFSGESVTVESPIVGLGGGTGVISGGGTGIGSTEEPPPQCTPLSEHPNLVAFYEFENDLTDSEGSADFTQSNSPTYNSSTPLDGGYSINFEYDDSQSAYLTDADAYSAASNFPLCSSGTQKTFSVLMWVRFNGWGSVAMTVIGKYIWQANPYRSFLLQITSDAHQARVYSAIVGNTAPDPITHNSALSLDTKYMLAYTYDNSTLSYRLSIYTAGGNKVGTDLVGYHPDEIYLSPAEWRFGARENGRFYDGLLDKAMFFDAVLTEGEIAQYAQGDCQ
jgi:hypothetical protein